MRQLYTTIRMPDGSPDQQRAFNDLMRSVTTSKNATNLLRAYLDVDLREVAPKVRCPTIIFHARGDGVAPFDEGRSLAALIPDARFVPLDSRNQLLTADESAWQQFVDEFNAFLPSALTNHDQTTDPSLDELTARERDVLELVAQGLDNTTIGDRLGISERTVRNNVSIIFSKIGVHTRAQAIVRAREAGLGRG